MNDTPETHRFSARADVPSQALKAAFYAEFQRSLKQCIFHGFSVEECFGVIWEETLEHVRLEDTHQSQAYEDLISWARQCRHEIPPSASLSGVRAQ
jgi:hypothetical protein